MFTPHRNTRLRRDVPYWDTWRHLLDAGQALKQTATARRRAAAEAALNVECPVCRSQSGEWCRKKNGNRTDYLHEQRLKYNTLNPGAKAKRGMAAWSNT